MSFTLPLHCNSREDLFAKQRRGAAAICSSIAELYNVRKHQECVLRARKLFIGNYSLITAIYIDRISLPITIATRQTTRSFLRLNIFMFPNSRYKNCNCIWSSSLIKKYISLKYSLFKNWQKTTI